MTPTLIGRIETRIFVLVVVGGLWTLLVSPFLPGIPGEAGLGDVYELTFEVLATVLLAGLVWELVYHLLQQFRWEKDWPALFGLLTGINEGIVAHFATKALFDVDVLPGSAYVVHFTTTWLLTWFFVNGPMRVLFLRWRFDGGRIL
ncbi:MAG TPA: hypothetical protein VGB14_07520 [Acidimicrobiales bacterium]